MRDRFQLWWYALRRAPNLLAMGSMLVLIVGVTAVARNEAINRQQQRLQSTVTFSDTSHDFGKVLVGTDLHWSFRFLNGSESSISIAGIDSSCGCLVAYNRTASVETGNTGEIDVKLSTQGMHPHSLRRLVKVRFDNGLVVPLNVSADLRSAIRVEPESLRLSSPDPNGESKADLVVKSEMLAPDDFLALQLKAPTYVHVSLLARTDSEVRWSLAFRWTEAPGVARPLKLSFASRAGKEEIVVPVVYAERSMVAIPPVYVVSLPRLLDVKNVRAATTRSIRLASRKGARVKIESFVSPDTPWLKLRWKDHSSEGKAEMSLWVEDEPAKTLTTSHAVIICRDIDSGVEDRIPIDVNVLVTGQ